MFELNKISQLVTVSAEMKLAECEALLLAEGFWSGYKPVGHDEDTTYAACLAERIPNYYFLQYGGIEDLCVGGEVITPAGHQFTIKTAPRSATGPDLRRMVVGSDNLFGHFKTVTLRVFPLPQKSIWGLCLMDHPSHVPDFLKKMLSSFIRPLFTTVVVEEETEKLMENLKAKAFDQVAFVFKLADLSPLIEAKKEALIRLGEEAGHFFYWPNRLHDEAFLDETLIQPRFFKLMARRYADLLLHGVDVENLAEKRLKKQLGA